jgi:hypothetical protein
MSIPLVENKLVEVGKGAKNIKEKSLPMEGINFVPTNYRCIRFCFIVYMFSCP